MTEEMKIEELLNSYIDGELSVRQRTEVKRMAANDPNIAGRLRQLQKCRTLVSALPIANAPSHIMENIKSALDSKKPAEENVPVHVSDYRDEKTGFFLFRRVFAAAAMLSLAAVLVIVINMLMPSQTSDTSSLEPFSVAAKFSGKLELKTNDLPGVQSVISEAIKKSGFPDSATPLRESNRRIFTLNCSREGLSKILNDLEGNWDKISSAKLLLDTEVFGESVEVASVIPSQISEIINQKDSEQSIKVAQDISIINNVNDILNDRGIPAAGNSMNSGMFRIPQPIIVSRDKYPSLQQDNGEKTIQLRIILSR